MKVAADGKTGQVGQNTRYIVEYDLPADNRRKRFYRAVKRYLRAHDLDEIWWSTNSVVFTRFEDFAWHVYREARKVGGTSHIYEARRLNREP